MTQYEDIWRALERIIDESEVEFEEEWLDFGKVCDRILKEFLQRRDCFRLKPDGIALAVLDAAMGVIPSGFHLTAREDPTKISDASTSTVRLRSKEIAERMGNFLEKMKDEIKTRKAIEQDYPKPVKCDSCERHVPLYTIRGKDLCRECLQDLFLEPAGIENIPNEKG